MLSFRATPLEKFSILHGISIPSLIGLKSQSPALWIVIDFNVYTPIEQNPNALLTFHLRDSEANPPSACSDFCIANLTRWRLDISRYRTFMGYLQKLNRKHYLRITETQKTFSGSGAKIALIEDDWSQYAEQAYKLYTKVADKHGTRLYDLDFFREIAKLPDYKLMCVWQDESLIGVLIILDEEPVIHSVCCGLDYDLSKKSQAYSHMHYEFIRFAIEAGKFTIADIGPTANEAKSTLGFQPVNACMEVWAHNFALRGLLRFFSQFMTATINSKARLKISFRFPGKKAK